MTETTPMRIREIKVEKLFGLYDHCIPLHVDERVTIVHGPNGVGKTVVLKLVAALFAGRLYDLSLVRFKRFEVSLTDGTKLVVEPLRGEAPDERNLGAVRVTFRLSAEVPGQKPLSHEFSYGWNDAAELSRLLKAEFPWLHRIGEDQWIDETSDQILSHGEVLSRSKEISFVGGRGTGHTLTEPEWFASARSGVSVHLIETQRLLRVPRAGGSPGRRLDASPMVPTVRDHASDLQGRIKDTLARYGGVSQALDQSFPQRLLGASGAELAIEEIKARMVALDQKRAMFKILGLLEESAAYPFDVAAIDRLDPTELRVMTLYVQDTETKLGVLADLANRVELLRDNVNAKFLHKSITMDRAKGFFAVGDDGVALDLDSLSSGEQHELVLLYDLLFRVKPDSLVLIDEPELSLHVAWQKRFLPDLLQIVKTAQFDALVATHSPFIVGDRSDLMVPLAAEIA